MMTALETRTNDNGYGVDRLVKSEDAVTVVDVMLAASIDFNMEGELSISSTVPRTR